MRTKTFLIMTCFLCLSFLLFAGCASRPVLISKSGAVPSGVDLSGYWRIRKDPKAIRLPGSADRDTSIIREFGKNRRDRRRRSSESTAQVFLELGESLKISQTDFGLFISYDRSVVEEYTFGENRTVSIGPIEAQRVSGWEGSAFVVETLDSEGSFLLESWQLEENNAVLARKIRITKGDHETFSVTQLFDRR